MLEVKFLTTFNRRNFQKKPQLITLCSTFSVINIGLQLYNKVVNICYLFPVQFISLQPNEKTIIQHSRNHVWCSIAIGLLTLLTQLGHAAKINLEQISLGVKSQVVENPAGHTSTHCLKSRTTCFGKRQEFTRNQ